MSHTSLQHWSAEAQVLQSKTLHCIAGDHHTLVSFYRQQLVPYCPFVAQPPAFETGRRSLRSAHQYTLLSGLNSIKNPICLPRQLHRRGLSVQSTSCWWVERANQLATQLRRVLSSPIALDRTTCATFGSILQVGLDKPAAAVACRHKMMRRLMQLGHTGRFGMQVQLTVQPGHKASCSVMQLVGNMYAC